MKHSFEAVIFQIDELRSYEWNPTSYNAGGAINDLISRDFAPLKDRLMNAKARLELIPNIVAAAKANLKNPPRIHTETAIQQNKGVIALIKGDLQMFADQAGMKTELAPSQEKAVKALEEYGAWLEKDLLPRSNGGLTARPIRSPFRSSSKPQIEIVSVLYEIRPLCLGGTTA